MKQHEETPYFKKQFKRVVLVSLLCLGVSRESNAAEPLEVLLKELPDQKVSFEVVLGYALKSSSFKIVAASWFLPEATKLRSQALLDFHLVAKQQSLRDLSKPQTILSPEEVISQASSLGFNKSFQTGTSFAADWTNKKLNTNFGGGATGNPTFDSVLKDRSEYMPEVSVSIKQDLLKNSFGRAVRASLTQAEKQSESQKIQAREAIKVWYFGLLKTFYGAWLAQEQVRQADKDYQRQLRLYRVSEQRFRRGNTEQADFLQIKVGLNLSEQRKIAAQQKLGEIWHEVVAQLELPAEWLQIDPLQVPLQLDEPTELALEHCERGWVEAESVDIQLATIERDMAEAQELAAKSRLLPDVSAFATIKRGSRNSSASDAQKEVARGEYPVTTYGVQLDWNFFSSQEKAQALEARVARLKANSMLVVKKGSAQSAWVAQCSNLRRLSVYQGQLKLALKDQNQRLDLEEKRFREGRSLLLQLIQAQGDLNSTQGLHSQNSIDLRLSAWDVFRQGHFLSERVGRVMEDFSSIVGGH
ncbi:MAG: hypothetical protein RJB66_910 [Pseudomonadota bacterium]|jgi:outer membrane protein TolC